MPNDFTATPPGSNPDHDSYGGTPWNYMESYYSGALGSLAFSTNIDGGLSGWGDGGTGFLAKNTTGSTIGGVPAGGFAMEPPQLGTVTLAWISPVAGNVSVNGSITQANPGSGCGFAWAVTSGNAIFAHGNSGGASSASSTVPVQPGSTIGLNVQDSSVTYSASCVTAVVSLTLQFSSGAPVVSMTSPAANSTVSGQPTFAGRASSGFGNSSTVTVRVYGGSQASGNPVETLRSSVSGGTYSAAASPPLANGRYTAQAEQDDLGGNRGFSPAVTFAVQNDPPTVTLNPVRSPFVTSTPVLTGTAGVSNVDNPRVFLNVYSGASATGPLVRLASDTTAADGSFSIRIAPGLPDGLYTAVAAQGSLGGNGFSAPRTFEVKVHPPALTFIQPAPGASINGVRPLFSGAAGQAVGDNRRVKFVLYRGARATGRPVATQLLPVRRFGWSFVLPRRLPLGIYSAAVRQGDNAGHVVTLKRSFRVTTVPFVIGYVLNLNSSGRVSIRVTCPAAAGTCSGDVLAVTVKALRSVSGGPGKRLRLLFAHVRIRARQTSLVRGKLSGPVAALLRRNVPVAVRVGAILTAPNTPLIRASGYRLLTVQ